MFKCHLISKYFKWVLSGMTDKYQHFNICYPMFT